MTPELWAPQFWFAAVEIIVINILLSGDNAVVIALSCRNLPDKQRSQGVLWGVVGAVVLRIALTAFASRLLELPYVKLVGAVLLIWIGVKLIAEDGGEEPEITASHRLWDAIRTIIVADAVMSLDNVVGVASAAKGSVALLVFGLVVSIPIVVLASQLVMKLIARFPLLVLAGGGLLGWLAGELALDDPLVHGIRGDVPAAHIVVPAVLTACVVAVGYWISRRHASAEA